MVSDNKYDVIIIGGSYSGLAAAMALGRALRKVLIIDSGKPCNAQTPYSHNFLTQDGSAPKDIAAIASRQVQAYDTIEFINGSVVKSAVIESGFEVHTAAGEVFAASKLVFATGIKDDMPDISGFSECWGISVLHCPYCHGYEVRNQRTGILGNGEGGFEFAALIANWTNDLTLYTNGPSTLTPEQAAKLKKHNINIVQTELAQLEHQNGHLQNIVFKNGSTTVLSALYARRPFVQHCSIPEVLGCELNSDGYIKVDHAQQTTVEGVFACGDNTTRLRTVANAVAMGTAAGMMVSKQLIDQAF